MFKRNKEGLERAYVEIKRLWNKAVGNTATTESDDEEEEDDEDGEDEGAEESES